LGRLDKTRNARRALSPNDFARSSSALNRSRLRTPRNSFGFLGWAGAFNIKPPLRKRLVSVSAPRAARAGNSRGINANHSVVSKQAFRESKVATKCDRPRGGLFLLRRSPALAHECCPRRRNVEQFPRKGARPLRPGLASAF